MFDVAIYTDTRADEAIDGIDGFNFQAASKGITAQDRQVIRDNMLHRVIVGWGVDHDPLTHPPTFVYYNHGGRYLLSNSPSTGVTNNDRSGKLFPEAIALSVAADFAMMRPAQLFGAVNWTLRKAPGKHLEQWAAPLEVMPEFETEALCRLIKNDPWATEHLAEFLTMVEQVTAEESKRLIIICSDPVLAQRWIALGTLFIDTQRALGLMIRGLVQDPMITKGDIVASSSELGPQPDALAPRAGVNIVDLDNRKIGAVPPSESALAQTKWFLEEDSGTALAAIELARRWEAFLGRDLATRAAAIASFPNEQGSAAHWLSAITALKTLADHHQSDELFFYGDALIDSAVAYAPRSVDEARTASDALVALLENTFHDLAIGVLMPSLEAIAGRPDARDAWLAAVGSAPEGLRLSWEDVDAQTQASRLLSMMADEVSPGVLPSLFSASLTLQIPLSKLSRIRAIQGLADLWSVTPTLTGQQTRWANGDQVVAELSRILARKWASGDHAALRGLAAARWSWLTTSPGLSPADLQTVAPWVEAGRMSKLPMSERIEVLAVAVPLPPESWAIVWSGLVLPVDHQLIVNWADTQHVVTADAGRWLIQQIDTFLQTGEPAPSIRKLLVRLSEDDVRVLDKALAAYAHQVSTADSHFRTAVEHWDMVPNVYLQQAVNYIPQMSALMHDYIGEAILVCKDTRNVSRLVTASEDWAESATLAALKRRCGSEEGMQEALLWALMLLDGALAAPAQAAQDFLLSVSDDRHYRVLSSKVASRLDRNTRARLEDFMKNASRGRLRRRFTKSAASLVSGKPKER